MLANVNLFFGKHQQTLGFTREKIVFRSNKKGKKCRINEKNLSDRGKYIKKVLKKRPKK
jgi:hypothetical protein